MRKSTTKSRPSLLKAEVQVSKSPAEFFAENQAIAGFDNLGKSLYTTIRELVENSLDACESVNVLPDIVVSVEEMSQKQFNEWRGVENGTSGSLDTGLFQKGRGKKAKGKAALNATGLEAPKDDILTNETFSKLVESVEPTKTVSSKMKKSKSEESYFQIKVRDNGCGMEHKAIPNLLGRVLSGSKYGVRQTRGKFGLGAKMALIWSKKSTGVPIKITTAHMQGTENTAPFISRCVLDIDIYRNRPKVMEHTQQPNDDHWIGTEFQVHIAGNWSTYKARIVQYLQQLAIITPYAKLELVYTNLIDCKKDMSLHYKRRSDQMPPPAREVQHHPSSVNNLVIQQLLDQTHTNTFVQFLSQDLSGISVPIAKRVIAELGGKFHDATKPSSLTGTQVTQLVQLLRRVELFKPPDGSCLSPLGEYNLLLGIRKVIEPEFVATHRDKASAYDGHPFVVEAAVCLGGKAAKEGITVFRFANRIPLLFEGGADVVTRVAQSKIKWVSYKMDFKRDKIGVFVSIVSTKVPFKGTGKEYIGDDILEIQLSVKKALQMCCQQLRSQLTKRNALKELKERRSRLVKYIPDVSNALFLVLDQMRKRKSEEDGDMERSSPGNKRRTNKSLKGVKEQNVKDVIHQINTKQITVDILSQRLLAAVDAHVETGEGSTSSLIPTSKGDARVSKDSMVEDRTPLYMVPRLEFDPALTIHHPFFTFQPLTQVL